MYVQLIVGKIFIFNAGKRWAEEQAPEWLRKAAQQAIASARRENDGEPVSFSLGNERSQLNKLQRNQKKFGALYS